MLPVVAALLLAGCGSSGSGQDTGTLVKDTFGAAKPVSSGNLALAVDVAAPGISGLPSPLHVRLAGPFAKTTAAGPRFDFELRLGTGAKPVSLGLIASGGQTWVRIGEHAYTLSPGTFRRLTGTKQAKASAGITLQSLGVDPRTWLRDVQDQGNETLRGEQVVHLTAGVDTPRFLTDLNKLLGRAGSIGAGAAGLPSGISAARRAQLAASVKSAHVDIWTGTKDHQLRRITVTVAVDTPQDHNGTVTLDLALSALNEPQAIGPPANPRPLSDLTAALAVLTQRRAAAAGSGTSAAPAPAPGETYSQCISRSGGDVAAAQQCANLLN
ncbi:MAG TPA: hypothetical protein VII98_09245 [Solirubrobacteraceae bacterium]